MWGRGKEDRQEYREDRRADKMQDVHAHARMDTHEAQCAERYGNIKQEMSYIKDALNALSAQMHGRLNTISSRMWGAAIGVLLGATAAFGTVTAYWINSIGHVTGK